MDWKAIANGPWIWICGFISVAIGVYQAVFFMRKAIETLEKHGGYTRQDVMGVVRGSAITAFGPVLAEVFIMLALVVAISPGYAWQREGVGVGSVFYEVLMATYGGEAAGEEFGTAAFGIVGFATTLLVANVACLGWPLGSAFYTPYLGKIRERIGRGDIALLGIITICATLGAFGYQAAARLIQGGGLATSTIVAMLLAMFLFKLADWIERPHLKEWALGLAMFGGMIVAQLVFG
jgi:hypothetical protein